MNSLNQLKQELLTQKTAITNKGGTVTIAHTNPSPAEITAGINSIPILDMTEATATTSDVLKGKTFYAGDKSLKTGALEIMDAETYEILHNNYYTPAKADVLDYSVPAGTLKLRPYYMAYNPSHINLTLNNELQEIGAHAFDHCSNINILNFEEMQNCTKIGDWAFLSTANLDMSNIPSCIQEIGTGGFGGAIYTDTIKIPSSVTVMKDYAFGYNNSTERYYIKNIDLSECTLTEYPRCMFQCMIATECDLTFPSCLTKIPYGFIYYGCVKSILLPATIQHIGTYAFGCPISQKAEDNFLNTIVLESSTPPTADYQPFGPANMRANTKIYVPDESIEAYKAHVRYKDYASYMRPMSEKP